MLPKSLKQELKEGEELELQKRILEKSETESLQDTKEKEIKVGIDKPKKKK